jgi:hypothetical protein
VKVLVQNIKTGKFLAKDGQWVAAEIQAVDLFTLSRDRLETIKGPDFRAVLYFPGENGESDIAIEGKEILPSWLPSRCELKPLEPPDTHYLRAAQGWIELGNPLEAGKELEHITPAQSVHPEVLKVRAKIHFAARKK